ncbi:hypothetical protein TNCV_1060281 [Trichonephila clavipes]|nr:hypothetical protein TNCV_1060281 [Trichonephila clavipes]
MLILRLEITLGTLQHVPRGRVGQNFGRELIRLEVGVYAKHEASTFRSINFYFPVSEPEFEQGYVVLQIRDHNGKSLILRVNSSIIGKHR